MDSKGDISTERPAVEAREEVHLGREDLPTQMLPVLDDLRHLICERCARIDIESLGREQTWRPERGNFVTELGTTAELASSLCPLCRLLATISPSQDELTQHDPVHLRSFSARREFSGISTFVWMSEDSTLLGVLSNPNDEFEQEGVLDPVDPRLVASLRDTGLLFITGPPNKRPQSCSVRSLDPDNFDIEIARQWQRYCYQHHTLTCLSMTQPQPRSLSLIDCRTRRIVQPRSWVSYAALSYVWGARSSNHSLDPSETKNMLHHLPKTIEDSIEVATRLDIWYLWVDRYCIDEDSPSDKHDQIQQMDAIYRSAALTIIAAAGEGPDHGLPGINGTTRTAQQTLRLGDFTLAQTLSHPSVALSASVWATRGWTYQEGLLSRRRLIFTPEQVFFECEGMHCREAVTIPLDDMHLVSKQRFKADAPSGSFDAKRPGRYPLMYMRHVAEFYFKQLSYPSDALNAMHGIFKSFQEQPPKRAVYNICGIPILPGRFQSFTSQRPLHPFLTNLFWYHTEPGHRRPEFPSWSWVGWHGGTISPETFVKKNESYSKLNADTSLWVEEKPGLLREFAEPVAPNTWLDYQDSRFLHIQTWILDCTIVNIDVADLPSWKSSPGLYARFQLDDERIGCARFHPSITPTELQHCDSTGQPKQYLGLILPFSLAGMNYIYMIERYASVLVVEDKGDCYERVGVFHLYSHFDSGTDEQRADLSFCMRADGKLSSFKNVDNGWERGAKRQKRKIRLG
ncbi:hypothetical protein HBI56_026140 [Parastagonospora nodorum]|uniref:Heterokaryon incompatibility domain-containing protein n=2 Tax=Phaeosphaeria nodorum (strain SN15 / ATCC MYA-4574 / FGSC 10173) TaxID=321614 RepID=A0A7U2EXP7_PHANO|nr:hypothetical protein HBH56_013800 [Parastagonospora nodorum]QRC94892.1 hypothetical protein JI435_026380 [Parastagonospora nodorum SN15]KAH3936919.1 hypothetical protein HBH54_020660 [Parastagonospora nodorum]KAH3953800.1 hypothetical protein HBH53_033060 [Parastagonospora nodorum]KAH3969270.1 hypothetical protein HBH51_125220 [Parastagonospora nodorum]